MEEAKIMISEKMIYVIFEVVIKKD